MTSPFLQRAAAWLCLAVGILTGISPAQGFVLCIEEDGCVRVELKSPETGCSGCDGHESGEASEQQLESPAGLDECACIDLAVPGSRREERLRPSSSELRLGTLLAPLPEPVARCVFEAGLCERGPPARVPREPDSLTLIRSVVLLL